MSTITNPLLKISELKHGAVPFDEIEKNHFLPALDYAILNARKTLNALKQNPENVIFNQFC